MRILPVQIFGRQLLLTKILMIIVLDNIERQDNIK